MLVVSMEKLTVLSLVSFYDVAGDCPEGVGLDIELGNRLDRLVNQILGEFF